MGGRGRRRRKRGAPVRPPASSLSRSLFAPAAAFPVRLLASPFREMQPLVEMLRSSRLD